MRIRNLFRREKPAAPRRIAPTIRERRPLVPRRRSFESAASSDITASWTRTAKSADQVVFQNLETLRARSRDLQCNNDHVRRFIALVRANVVGAQGIRVQSKVTRPGQNNTEADTPARRAIEAELARWGRAEHCNLQGQLSWVEIQQLAAASIAGDGEAILREHTAGPYGYQLELIDPQLLDVKYCEDLGNGHRILFGIEYDQRGRAVAYHFKQPSAGPLTYTAASGNHYQRVDAREIRHLFLCDFVGQKRGIPWTATPALRLKMIGAFEDAALVNARVGASKMGFIKRSAAELAYTGDDQPDVDQDTGDYHETLEPGTVGYLNDGEDFVGFDPAYPSGDFGPFVKNCLRSVAAGLGVSYHNLAQDLEGVNYSSAKVGELVDKELWMCLQDWLTDKLVRPVFETWLARQHVLGTIKIGANPLGRPLEQYLPARYQPKRWKEIDPLKAVSAQREAVALGKSSISQLILEDGGDPDEVFQQLADDIERLRALGLPLPSFLPPEAYKALGGDDEPAATGETDHAT